MKRVIVIMLVAAVLIGGSIFGIGYLRNSQEAANQNERTAQTDKPAPVTEEVTKEAGADSEGVYGNYSESSFDSTDGRRVLFFHAPWCPQCRMIEADIKDSSIPSGVTIFKTDYDSNQDLRQKYGVTLQTTFVEVGKNGALHDKYVAYNEPTFDSVKTNLLDK